MEGFDLNRVFYRFCPVLFGTLGILLIGTDYFVDKYLPTEFRAYFLISSIALFAFLGLALGRFIQRLYSFGYTDILTGLRNRGYFYSRVNFEMKRVRRKNSKLSLLMIDVDNFKAINDTYGHLTGDKVLKHIAHTFVKTMGRKELIARWGGEEFAIILPETGADDARKTAETIRRAIENCTTFSSFCQSKVTISIGAATIADSMSTEDFVRLADKALYKAKERKNVVVWTSNYIKEYKVSNL
jgi:diguanylate cyclase (GGDEF)-like protein